MKVYQYRNHETVSWIPSAYWEHLTIIPDDSDELGFVQDPTKPLVVIDHGIGNFSAPCTLPEVRDCYSLCYADFYLSSTYEGHLGMLAKGKKSRYVGSAISDIVKPDKITPEYVIYAPDHGVPTEFGMWYGDTVLPPDILNQFVKQYNLKDYITSALHDDKRLLSYTKREVSNRRTPEHFFKMKSLYSVAGLVVSPIADTFANLANAFGIEVVSKNTPLTTYGDGNCKKRILEALDAILTGRF